MVHISIDPILLQLGPLNLSWHGLFLTAGVVLGCWVFAVEARRQGLARDRLAELILCMVLAGYAGARLLQVLLYDWRTYAVQPQRILAVNEGGLAIYGGLIGGTLAVVACARWRRLPFWRLADAAALAIPAGLIVGRVGCTIAGDACGTPTQGAWGLVYTHPDASVPAYLLGLPTFPAPIVMQIGNAGLLALLLVLRQRGQRASHLFLTFLLLYSAGRFVLSFWQVESAILLGLHPTQVVALVVAAASAVLLLWPRLRRTPAP
jgi:phosphatidylglycerol:prolipoprotein diacylglycerol transferase